MKFHSSVIFVKNVEIAKDFYVRILSQEIEHDFGKNVILKSGLTIWEIPPEHDISKKLETKGISNRFELYFETDLLEEAYKKLNKEKTEFIHKIHEEPWGQRTMRFLDPDKHLIEIGEPLEVFVANKFNNGLTVEQISEKSGIPLKTVNKILR